MILEPGDSVSAHGSTGTLPARHDFAVADAIASRAATKDDASPDERAALDREVAAANARLVADLTRPEAPAEDVPPETPAAETDAEDEDERIYGPPQTSIHAATPKKAAKAKGASKKK